MMERTAIITGANGFIGSHLVQRLVADGWRVHIIVRPNSGLDLLKRTLDSISIHRYDGMTESMAIIMQTVKPDVVFHLASLFLSNHHPKDIEGLVSSNILLGTQLMEAMAIAGMSCLINTGTAWQHYKSNEYNPVNLYAATKQAFQDILAYYVDAGKLKAITLKLCDTYGSNDPRPKLFNLIAQRSADAPPLELSPGDQYIDIVHVSDVVQAYIVAADRLMAGGVTRHEAYSVTSGEPVKLKDLVEKIQQWLGRKGGVMWGAREYREREVMAPWVGPTLPGWKPVIDMEHAIRQRPDKAEHG
jgi:nucleoside-diphosphate-sugar epimerase